MKEQTNVDLHIHSVFSDGKLSIREIVDLYGQRGYGAIAITDHLCETKNLIGRMSHRLNFSLDRLGLDRYMTTLRCEARRAWDKYSLLVLPGFEITKNSFANHRSAHLVVVGIESFIDPDLEVEEILASAKQEGALVIAAHPFNTGEFEFQSFYLWSRRRELSPQIDAWEFNSRRRAFASVLNSGLPVIANSDLHFANHFSSWKTKCFSDRSRSGVFSAIRGQQVDFFQDSI